VANYLVTGGCGFIGSRLVDALTTSGREVRILDDLSTGRRENRLDFTVIGAAVNEASRLEALCDQLGRHLVISEKFAAAATHCTGRLVSLGRHELRGVSGDQELFTVDY
jgi:class 3 adenylate cyclase